MWKIAALLLAFASPARAQIIPGIQGCAGDALQQVTQGCARVYPLPGINEDFPALLAAEEKARTDKTGIWSDPAYTIRTPDKARELLDSYGLVEGRVTGTGKAKGKLYINFGPDWKTDFTAELTGDAAKQLQARNIDWQALTGQTIRLRGWVFWLYGPMIRVTTDAQIELLR